MADCGQPNAMSLMAGQMLNAQQNLEAVREFSKPAAGPDMGALMGLGPMGPVDHGAMMMGGPQGMHPADVHPFMPPPSQMPMLPEFMGMPPPPEMMHHHHPMHAAGAPPHDLVAEFERFHLENATSGGPMHMPDQMAEFERAYQQARPMPPPPHALMHAPHMQHHMPPEAWASEFQQIQPGPQHGDVDFDKVYHDVVQGPASMGGATAEEWAQQFDADELEDLDDYFRQAEADAKDGAFEDAYSEAAPQLEVDARGAGGVDKAAIDRLLATSDPKMRNSQFMQFLSKVSTGEISFQGNQVVHRGPMQGDSKEAEWADLYASDAHQQQQAWADDYASAEELAAVRGSDGAQWAAEYEEQQHDEDEYGNAEDYDPEDWTEDFNYLDWNSLNAAKQAMNGAVGDPTYQFSAANPYAERDDAFQEAMRLYEAGNLAEATLAFEAVVNKQPDNADCWRQLGQCHAENESESQAIAALLKAVEFDPYNLEALLLLSVSYTNDLEHSRALGFLKHWLQHHPDYQQIAQDDDVKQFDELYGGSSDPATQHEMVTNLFLRASQAMPGDADVLVALGVLYNLSSDYVRAIETFQRAATLRPQDASIWNKLGATQANSERSPEALSAYKKALDLRPNYVRALANLGIAYANQNMHEEASSAYLATLARNPMAEHVWSYLRLSLASMGREDLVQLAHEKNLDAFRGIFQF